MVLKFQLSLGSSTPLYQQIADQVRKAVATGNLVEGDSLPSVRVLAEQLVINPNTVARAYGELVHDGVVLARQGKGLFVAERRQIFSEEERTRRLNAALDTFLHEVMLLDFSPKEIREAMDRKMSKLGFQSNRKTGGSHE